MCVSPKHKHAYIHTSTRIYDRPEQHVRSGIHSRAAAYSYVYACVYVRTCVCRCTLKSLGEGTQATAGAGAVAADARQGARERDRTKEAPAAHNPRCRHCQGSTMHTALARGDEGIALGGSRGKLPLRNRSRTPCLPRTGPPSPWSPLPSCRYPV